MISHSILSQMLNLNHLNINLDKAKKEHFEFFACYVNRKLFSRSCAKSTYDSSHPERPQYCTGNKIKTYSHYYKDIRFFQNFISSSNRLEKILVGSPNDLLIINDDFKSLVDNHFGINVYDEYIELSVNDRSNYDLQSVHHFFHDISTIFNYGRLAKDKYYSSYRLTENLGVRTCVYCNRTYAITYRKNNGGRLMNPQLDHWFPKSDFPLLQISFHNLIPSCEVCNSRVKNDVHFNLTEHYHPYQAKEEQIHIKYRPIFDNKIKIYFSKDSDTAIKKTCEEMFIDQMYEAHKEELEDLIMISEKYSKSYIDILKNTFPSTHLSDKQIYRLVFGVEFDKKDFHKRPMSKFKYDILKELKII